MRQNTIALVYDFDGTLSPLTMQHYTVFPEFGIDPDGFWAECDLAEAQTKGDRMLTYLRLLIDHTNAKGRPITREILYTLAGNMVYFPGVESWFERINAYVRQKSDGQVNIEHYIISAGHKEVLEGTSIYKHLRACYGSEYYYSSHGYATFANRTITDSIKTQYLYRINKGALLDEEPVNHHMDLKDRPIPFKNMVYFGDGKTDVPSMRVVTREGGHAIAVYPENDPEKREICDELLADKRVNFYSLADYREGTELSTTVELLLNKLIAEILYQQALPSS